MIVKVLSVSALICAGCTDVGQSPPKSGTYADSNEKIYEVNTKGGPALTITGPDDFCLQFWRDNEPKIIQGVEKLEGQRCKNRTFGDLQWSLTFAYKKPEVINIYPPNVFKDKKLKPITVYYREDLN
jgi:hypothetical protein